MSRRNRPRRGALLLIVLSILVLFLLIAVTYVIIAGRFKDGAESFHPERTGDHPQKLLDGALYQIVRDTTNPQSVVLGHGLLRDLYGSDSVLGSLDASANVTALVGTGNQIIKFDVTPGNLSTISGYYNGCVLTMTEGPAKGLSTRIIGYDASVPTIRVLAFNSDTSTAVRPENGDNFLINGRPFNGTGFGYDPSTGKLDIKDTVFINEPMALLPNRVGDNVPASLNQFLAGGADESYDAVDYQNMLLAMVPPGASTSAKIIPSLHRPALINYWKNQPSWSDTSFRRRVIFRPMMWDHPKFSGSNSAFAASRTFAEHQAALIEGAWDSDGDSINDSNAWDVDNDGDGVPDSIWADLGYTIQTAPDGRRYKPLFAILCQDLDGRLNVNAHSNQWHLDSTTNPIAVPLAGNVNSDILHPGQGYGPPEINLRKLNSFTSADLERLMFGVTGPDIPGRYGFGVTATPGIDNAYDLLARIKFFEYPDNYFTSGTPTAFQSPPDLRGRLRFGLDYRGQPIYEQSTDADVRLDSPYEQNLSREATRSFVSTMAADYPFSIAELEPILRQRDIDSSTLPSRLRDLASSLTQHRQKITTDSYSLPVPNVLTTKELLSRFSDPMEYPKQRPLHIIDLLRERLIQGFGFTLPLTSAQETQVNAEIGAMLAPDLTMGLRMDVNRPFGDGRDKSGGNANATVDEPGEEAGELIWQDVGALPRAEFQNIDFNHHNGIDVDRDTDITPTDRRLARQLYARHLFVLMMMLKDSGANVDFDGNPTNSVQETARGIAQWAINAVDFRDADAIMTPFEYDIIPFDGWNVDGVLGSADDSNAQRGLVWGCERPELIFGETLAFHDRRTEDLSTEPNGKTTVTGETDDVNDFDQRLLPRGSFFVELYNPWASGDRVPAEFYPDGSNWQGGVVLNKVSPSGSPVWRLIVVKGDSHTPPARDPDDEFAPVASRFNSSDIDRSVYFTDPANLPPAIVHGTPYHTSLVVTPLFPGRYAVIGSSGQLSGGDYITTVGRNQGVPDPVANSTDLMIDSTRRLVLTPSAVNQFQMWNDDLMPPSGPAPPDIQPIVAVVIDQPRTLSISEPIGGYLVAHPDDPDLNPFETTAEGGEGAYLRPHDEPFDDDRPDLDPASPTILRQQRSIQNFRTVHLQRLANPLLDWHSVINPYRTIDTMAVDLTVFNGVTSDDEPTASGTIDFRSLQRGDQEDPAVLPLERRRNLWSHEPIGAPPTGNSPTEAAPSHHFPYILQHSLGFLNAKHQPFFDAATAPSVPYRGGPDSLNGGSPFPWLTWLNRPLVSQFELMQVPKSRSSRLLREYSLATGQNPYDPTKTAFGHLLDFFHSAPATAPFDKATHFYRLFEYTHVPSRFVGTETVLNPTKFASGAGTEFLHPPFNKVSKYRDPGKVNINTIFSKNVWDGVLNGHSGPSWVQLVDSRRGFGAGSAGLKPLLNSSDPPTFFANPIRSFGAGELVPLTALEREGVECTLLRSDASLTSSVPSGQPLFEPQSNAAYNNKDRNPYFRYQSMQRLGNLITTHSNVYAVWITVGFFEVDPGTQKLGQELGSETGEVKRHRAFYIIDRSIPVAFEPGKNHNVERAIVLRRFIE